MFESRRRANRGNPRRFADEPDRPRAVLQHEISARAGRLSTRNIPDPNGFEELGKSEIKRDMREIEKVNLMSSMGHHSDDEDDVDMDRSVKTRMSRPPCPPGSTLQRKKARYLAWCADPSTITSDLESYRSAVGIVKDELAELMDKEDSWLQAFNVVRTKLTQSVSASQRANEILKKQMDKILELSEAELGNGKVSRKRKVSVFSRDVVGELEERRDTILSSLAEYEKLINDVRSQKLCQPNAPPVAHIALDDHDMVSMRSTIENLGGRKRRTEEEAVATKAQTKADAAAAAAAVEEASKAEVGKTSEEDATAEPPAAEVPTGRSSARISNEEKVKTEDEVSNIKNIPSFLADDQLKMALATLNDMEPFFLPPVGEDGEEMSAKNQNLARIERILADQGSNEIQTKVAKFASFNRECDWVKLLDEEVRDAAPSGLSTTATGPSSNNKRKRRGGPSTIDLRAYVTPRTPRNVPLFVSPLSHYGDRYLGHITGDATTVASTPSSSSEYKRGTGNIQMLRIPASIRAEEEGVIERCSIASRSIQNADALKKVASQINDWNKAFTESQESLARLNDSFATVAYEATTERNNHRTEMEAIRRGDKTAKEALNAVTNAPTPTHVGFGVHAKKGIMKKKGAKIPVAAPTAPDVRVIAPSGEGNGDSSTASDAGADDNTAVTAESGKGTEASFPGTASEAGDADDSNSETNGEAEEDEIQDKKRGSSRVAGSKATAAKAKPASRRGGR